MARPHTASTWYQPLADPHDIRLAVHWVLGRPGVFVISVGDAQLLPHFLEAAQRFAQAPAEEEMQQMMNRLQMEPLFV
jgi:hypothetical protein